MASYFGFKVSNTNKSGAGSYSCVRVYNSEGKMIAEQRTNKHNPLDYIRSHNGKHKTELKAQCLAGGMKECEFDAVFGCKYPCC